MVAAASPPPDPRLLPAQAALVGQDYVAAFKLCASARRKGVPNADVLPLEADIFKATGYLDREIETLRQWTLATPRDVTPWLKLFYIYLDLGWRQEAETASRQALQIAPNESRSYVTHALLGYRSNEPAAGLTAIQEARRRDPNNLDLNNLYLTLLLKTFKYREAESEARPLVAKAPQHIANRVALAEALLGQDKRDEALAAFREIQQRDPQNLEAAYEIGTLAQQHGDKVEAINQFERVAAVDIGYSKTAFYLGSLYRQQGHRQEGERLLKMYQEMDNNAGVYETAMSRLETRPDDPALHWQLAQLHLHTDEIPQAIVELRRTLELKPGDTVARKLLATTLTRNGRATEARQLIAQTPSQ